MELKSEENCPRDFSFIFGTDNESILSGVCIADIHLAPLK